MTEDVSVFEARQTAKGRRGAGPATESTGGTGLNEKQLVALLGDPTALLAAEEQATVTALLTDIITRLEVVEGA